MILDDIAFRGLLGKGEVIKYVAHVHPFVIYPMLFKLLLFGIAMPAGAYFLLPPFKFVWMVWAGLGILLFLYKMMQWYLDAWIVTNYAIIYQNWESIFSKSTNRIDHGNIQGIGNEVKGFWGTILQFGNVQIEHVTGNPIVVANVAMPRRLERRIVSEQQAYVQRQSVEDHGKLKDLLTNLIRSS
jgi:hypothetical protein